jgi:hypothetical protein
MNDVFILPSQYIDKICKKEHYVEKKGRENLSLKARAARISRMATSVALKCSASEPLLDDLEKLLEKWEVEADQSLNKMRGNEVPLINSNDHVTDIENSIIPLRI